MNKDTRQTIVTLAIVGGGALIVYKLMQKIGIFQTQADIDVIKQNEKPLKDNPFSPKYYLQFGTANIMKRGFAQQLAKQIYDGMGYLYDDEAKIYGAFRELKNKAQVSFLAENFQLLYKIDLLQFLTRGKGVLPQAGLNSEELQTIIKMVEKLPKN